MVRKAAVSVACVVALVVVGGCGDGESSGESPDDTTVPMSTSPSSTRPAEPMEPTPAAAMEKENPAGAKAFVRYFWEVVEYAQKTGDVTTLRTLAFDTCTACTKGADSLQRSRKGVTTATGGSISVSGLDVETLRAEKYVNYRVAFTVRVTEQQVVKKGGAQTDYDAFSAKYRFVVSRDQGEWRVALWEGQP